MDKKLIFILLAALAATSVFFYENHTSTSTLKDKYQSWKETFAFNFDATEDQYRFTIFAKSWEEVEAHNSKLGKTYTKGINQFSALTNEEFAAKHLSSFESYTPEMTVTKVESVGGPNVDWVAAGAVSPVKNEGSCTASYAFSAVGAIEGNSVIYSKITAEYSVQQLVDCSGSYGNLGCQKGTMQNSFNYVKAVGIQTWNAYPYTGTQGSCRMNYGSYRISGFNRINTCIDLANALTGRPISVAVDGQNFRNYRSGIFNNCGFSHSLAVLLVGMTDSYWTIKNDWGTSWGEFGFMRLYKGEPSGSNTCGICQIGSYPY